MEFLQSIMPNTPLAGMLAYVWWSTTTKHASEMKYLQDALARKDDDIAEFTSAINRLQLTLELFKDRLK